MFGILWIDLPSTQMNRTLLHNPKHHSMPFRSGATKPPTVGLSKVWHAATYSSKFHERSLYILGIGEAALLSNPPRLASTFVHGLRLCFELFSTRTVSSVALLQKSPFSFFLALLLSSCCYVLPEQTFPALPLSLNTFLSKLLFFLGAVLAVYFFFFTMYIHTHVCIYIYYIYIIYICFTTNTITY